jgi:hypothetical protein
MKKRLPILIVIFGALSLFLILKFSGSQEKTLWKDTDGDGFPDKIDKCISEPYPDNSGCPVSEEDTSTYKPDDKDGDGFFPDAMEESKHDPDDKNPCNPNKTCELCDEDGDKLTRKEELAIGTKVNMPDTDGDGMNDNLDKCPREQGLANNKGCKLVLNTNFVENGEIVMWNEELTKYAKSITLKISSMDGKIQKKIDVTNRSNIDFNELLGFGLKKKNRYNIDINIVCVQPDRIQFSGSERLSFRL